MNLFLSKTKPLRLTFVILLLTPVTFANPPAGGGAQDTKIDKVDTLFAQWDRPDSPGCALGIIKNGQFIYKRGYGMANLEYNIPISGKTVFRIGSTSKQFTAATILLLAEQGKLSLDDDIRAYVPEMPAYQSPITLRHLIHHTSGIRDYLTLMSLAGMRDDDFYTDDEVVDLLARQQELNFKPGDEFLYSNSGYFLLSVIAKRATGKSLPDLAEEMIFKPLGMSHTHFHDDHTMIVKNRASGYSRKKGGGFRINMTTLDMVGDGGVFTSMEDLFLWDQNFYHNKLGGTDLINQLLTPGRLNSGKKLDYAFGLTVSDYKGLKMISHGGAFVGFRAEMIRFPQQHFSVICLCNLSAINPSHLARRVADIYLADQFKPEKAKTGPAPAGRIDLSEAELKAKTGAFLNPQTGALWKLFVRDGKLMVKLRGRSFHLVPVSKTRFRAVNAPANMVVSFERQGLTQPLLIRADIAGQQPATLERVRLASPTPKQLADYVGRYISQELQVAYNVILDGGKLFLRHENRYKHSPQEPLEPTLRDRFSVSGINLHFIRDEQHKVSAFTMSAGRVKNIRFVRKGHQQ